MSVTLNGKPPRKQLADQIDRLDRILDGLAEALDHSVQDAAREGARSAVKEILVEVLTDPEVMNLVRTITAPATPSSAPSQPTVPPARPSLWRRFAITMATAARSAKAELRTLVAKSAAVVRSAAANLQGPIASVRATTAQVVTSVKALPTTIRTTVSRVRELPRTLRTATIVGVSVATVIVAVAAMNHTLGTVIAGTTSGLVATGAYLGWTFRRLLNSVRIV